MLIIKSLSCVVAQNNKKRKRTDDINQETALPSGDLKRVWFHPLFPHSQQLVQKSNTVLDKNMSPVRLLKKEKKNLITYNKPLIILSF